MACLVPRLQRRVWWASPVPRPLTTLFLFLKHNRNVLGGFELGQEWAWLGV